MAVSNLVAGVDCTSGLLTTWSARGVVIEWNPLSAPMSPFTITILTTLNCWQNAKADEFHPG